MKAPLIGLLLAFSLTGCQAVPSITPPAGKQPGASTNLTSLRLGSLQFQPASTDTMARMSQQGSGAARATAPMAAEAGMGAAADSKIAIAPSPYAYGSYFGGPFGQMKLESVTEAKAAGASAGFLDLQAQVIGPALADWAPDARLLNTNGTLDEQGNPMAGTETYPGELAWHASYASVSRNEVLEFTVSPAETHVVRMHWVPVAIDVSSVKVDAKAAVEQLAKAVTSRVRSKEEELGHDYFFNPQEAQGGAGVNIAVPARAVPPVAPTIAVGEPAPNGIQGPTTEVLYRLKAGGRWNVTLQAIGDHLVWELNYNAYPAGVATAVAAPAVAGPAVAAPASLAVMMVGGPKPGEGEMAITSEPNPGQVKPLPPDAAPVQPEPWTDENAYGMIDARTGELIRLRRPTKYTYAATPTVKTGTGVIGGGAIDAGGAPTGKQ